MRKCTWPGVCYFLRGEHCTLPILNCPQAFSSSEHAAAVLRRSEQAPHQDAVGGQAPSRAAPQNGARVSGGPEAGLDADGPSAAPALLAGAAPATMRAKPAPRCPDAEPQAQRPGNNTGERPETRSERTA